MFKLDQNGNEEWRKYFGGPYFDTGAAVEQTHDNDYIVTGGFSVDADETMDAILLKTDSSGEEEWRVTFGEDSSDECLEMHQTEDGGYIVVGFTTLYGGQDAWLVKFGAFGNQRPNTPSRPSGNASGKTNDEYTYTTSTIDPNGDHISYQWDWGDSTTSEWYGPYLSSEECHASHTWISKGNYELKVKAKDTNGAESGWSEPLPITMPYLYNLMHQLFELLFQRVPHAFPLLRQLLGY